MFPSAANSLLHGQFQEGLEGQILLEGPTVSLIPPPSVDLEDFLSNGGYISRPAQTHTSRKQVLSIRIRDRTLV